MVGRWKVERQWDGAVAWHRQPHSIRVPVVSTALSRNIRGVRGAKALKQFVLSAVQALRDQAQASQVNSVPGMLHAVLN